MQLNTKAETEGRIISISNGSTKRRAILPYDNSSGPLVCILDAPDDNNSMVAYAMMLSLVIACDAQHHGGILLHGALASLRGEGIILAAPGGTGKTTASKRLLPPWSSLCDDATLVVRDAKGQYWAHPWPTWSRFYENGPGGRWNVQDAVPLRAIFFLNRSENDCIESIRRIQAASMLMESANQVTQTFAGRLSQEDICDFHEHQLQVVTELSDRIPAYLLKISLTGEFWKHIEEVLDNGVDRQAEEIVTHSASVIIEQQNAFERTDGHLKKHDTIPVIYLGASMNPTLSEPDLLDVLPYQDRPMKRGDVIYFHRRNDDLMIIHRIAKITPDGIITRGDNNNLDDFYIVTQEEVVGQVVAAQRGKIRRNIAGGWQGIAAFRCARKKRWLRAIGAKLFREAYHKTARTGILQGFISPVLHPKIVSFGKGYRQQIKLMMDNRVIGQYDARGKTWWIRYPFSIFVDEAALPVCQTESVPR